MFKSEILDKYPFLKGAKFEDVVIEDQIYFNGVESRRVIDWDDTRSLHLSYQGQGQLARRKTRFGDKRVVTLDEALTVLFRRHPYTGEAIDDPQSPFHHSQMTDDDFLAFIFGQVVGDLSSGGGVGRITQMTELQAFNQDQFGLKSELLRRVEAAGNASSIKNQDSEALAKAQALVWFNNPNVTQGEEAPAMVGNYDLSQIRKMLAAAFSAGEIKTLAFDLFYETVHGNITAGMTRDDRIELILDHASRFGGLDEIVEYVQRKNSYQYRFFKDKLKK